jgi:putative intracellular protease/amidase
MTGRVHLAVLDTMADWEVGYLCAHLTSLRSRPEDARFRIVTVGLTQAPITTMGGLRILPEIGLDRLDPQDSAMLVLPGADTWGAPRTEPFVRAARRFLDAGVPVAAVCGATYGLAAAGLLDQRRHTSNDPSFLAASGYAGADRYVTEPAVIDGDLVTASGVAPVHFARAVFERLGAHQPDLISSWFKLYADREPAGFYELMAAESA